MIIRDANINDASDIVRINVSEWKNTYKDIFPDSFLSKLDYKDSNTISKCENHIDEYVVCEVDNTVVGFIRFGKNKKGYSTQYAEVYALYVDSNYRSIHVGTNLMEYVFNKLSNKYKYVLVSTLVKNNANEFYKKLGGDLVGTANFNLEGIDYLENIYCYKLDKMIYNI